MSTTIQVTVPFETESQQYTLSDFLEVVFSKYEDQENNLLTKIIKRSEENKENKAIDTDEFLSSLD